VRNEGTKVLLQGLLQGLQHRGHSCAPSRRSCGSRRSVRPSGSANTRDLLCSFTIRMSRSACVVTGTDNRPYRPTLPCVATKRSRRCFGGLWVTRPRLLGARLPTRRRLAASPPPHPSVAQDTSARFASGTRGNRLAASPAALLATSRVALPRQPCGERAAMPSVPAGMA